MYEDRMLCESLKDRIMSGGQAAAFIEPGMTVAFSGFSTGAPKAVPPEIVRLGKAKDLTLICGAALGQDVFGPLADSGIITRYSAFQFVPNIRNAINSGKIAYTDVHLGLLSQKLRGGVFGKIDVSVVECAKINPDGGIVPSVSVGISNALLECSEKVILEINTTVPVGIEGFHDICGSGAKPIGSVMERVGEPVYRCDPDKIAAIVITDIPEHDWVFRDVNEVYEGIAANVVECLNKEIESGGIEKEFTMQVGVGGVANTVLTCLRRGGFKDLKMYTEVFSDAALGFVEDGLFTEVSTTCFDLSRKCIEKVFNDIDYYKERIVLRPLEYTNGAPNIIKMGLVAMNTAVEADIYGNVNSTHSLGTNMIYGVGGSNDFARNAKLTVFLTPSTAKDGAISCIVPMVTHVDNSEHDTDIIVTEYGYADLRGLSPKERAAKIIGCCAHPDYRQQLWDYYNGALETCGPVQTPHNLAEAFSMHSRYRQTGSMKAEK
jgi:succinyl-CoA:acetate CoA-transferase